MAIVQISRITQRKGLQENLPQLAGAEFGWSIDERRLFIGNGTLQEGAPVIGNTEILTEFSDILAFQTNYTYKGEAAGYVVQTGPTTGTPVSQSLQSWLDQFATVKDFGAVGNGVTDDTEAINRALYQLFCREVNPQIRRSLFFPAGVYRVTETIKIPPFATLWGEGPAGSVIQLDSSTDDSSLNQYVARTADSLQQTGINISTNGATAPQYITISDLGFRNLDDNTDVFLVEDANNCRFQNVKFSGPLTVADLTTDGDDTGAIRFASTTSLVCSQIVFDNCEFAGATYGINTDQELSGITVSNSKFDTLYKGVVLGVVSPVNGGATGFRIVNNIFDNIYAEGVVFGTIELNATGYNIFYDVGNHFDGVLNPATSIISIQSDNNVSIGDMFERADAYATTYPRINLNDTTSIGITNSKQVAMGTFVRESGEKFTLVNNTSSAATIFTVNTAVTRAFCVDYTIIRDTDYRTGTLTITAGANYTDDFTENTTTGITLSVDQIGTTLSVKYTSSNTGIDGILTYSITRLD
jgi:hypothetical protein